MKKKAQPKKKSISESLSSYLSSKGYWIFAVSALLSAFIFFRLFDIRVNLAGDDSTYIMSGYRFLKEGIYPTWHSPLYSVFLAIPIFLAGISLPWLKITSSLFLLLSFYFFFKSYRNRMDPVLLFLTIFIVGINSYIAYYSSFTFSEAFFMFFQALFFYFIFRFIDHPGNKIEQYIYLGLLSVSLYMAKTVGLAGIITLLFYLGLQKEWKKLLFSLSSFAAVYFIVGICKKVIWGVSGNQFSSQLGELMQKDPYNSSLGNEDFVGFINRLIDNSNLYLSKHFFRFVGLRPYETTTIEPVLTIIFYAIILFALIYSFKKNKYIFFSICYLGAFLGITFLSVQKFWDQDRLIIPVFPLMLLGVLWGLDGLSGYFSNKILKILPYAAGVIILFLVLGVTTEKIREHKDIHKASMAGNLYYGFTPDWENYLKICAVAGEKLPDTAYVACRKPGIAFIYGKRTFHGISRVPTIEVDSLFKRNNFYYAVAIDDNAAQNFRREMLTGIFYGNAESEKYMTNKLYYLFESNEKMEMIDDKYSISSSGLKENFSNLALYSPDMLLNSLKENNVDHIISANLRIIPTQKTNQTITTVRRYMEFISIKYPDTFRKLYQVGQDEIAELYQINYPDR